MVVWQLLSKQQLYIINEYSTQYLEINKNIWYEFMSQKMLNVKAQNKKVI